MHLSYTFYSTAMNWRRFIVPLTQDHKRTYLPSAAICWMNIWKARARRSASELQLFPPSPRAAWPTSCLQRAPATLRPWTVSSSIAALCPNAQLAKTDLVPCLINASSTMLRAHLLRPAQKEVRLCCGLWQLDWSLVLLPSLMPLVVLNIRKSLFIAQKFWLDFRHVMTTLFKNVWWIFCCVDMHSIWSW